MARFPLVRLFVSTSLAVLGALALAGCPGNSIGFDGKFPAVCTAGELTESTNCAGTCPSGQVARLRCLDDGSARVCGCFPGNGGNGGTVNPPPTTCANTTVRYGDPAATCLSSCSAATQTTSETCVNNVWSDCRCVNRTYGCAANTVTFNGCPTTRTCASNEGAGQMCNNAGTGYSACDCYQRPGTTNPQGCGTAGSERACTTSGPSCIGGRLTEICGGNGLWGTCQCIGGTTQTCTPSTERVCSLSCASGQRPVQVCNSNGTWNDCYCAGSATVCTANQLTNISCSCPSGGNGTYYCNGNGTGYGTCNCPGSGTECTPNQLYSRDICVGRSCPAGLTSLQQCTPAGRFGDCQCGTLSGGGTGGTGNCGGGYIAATARNGLMIRCWGSGRTWTSSGSQLDASTGSLDGNQCGYTECVTGTVNSSGAFTEDGYYSNRSNAGRPASDMFNSFGVFGRDSSLNNTLGSSTMRVDARGNIKAVFAVSADCIGRGYCS